MRFYEVGTEFSYVTRVELQFMFPEFNYLDCSRAQTLKLDIFIHIDTVFYNHNA
jgi:hypothetical protein